jgi:hypothetical protein
MRTWLTDKQRVDVLMKGIKSTDASISIAAKTIFTRISTVLTSTRLQGSYPD